jgi:hypothetical protein
LLPVQGAQDALPTISAAASSPLGQSSQSGTRLSGADGEEPEELPAAARAGAGVPRPVALVPDGAAGAARGAGDPDATGPDPLEPDVAGEVVVADVVLAADVVPVPPALVLLPLVAVGVVTCAAAGAASTRPISKARRAGRIMAVTQALSCAEHERRAAVPWLVSAPRPAHAAIV